MPVFITPHRTGFKFQRAVPKAIQPAYGGRKVITKYLQGMTRSAAEAEGRILWAEYETQFRRLGALSPAELAAVGANGGLGGLKSAAANLTADLTIRAMDIDTPVLTSLDDTPITISLEDVRHDVVATKEKSETLDALKRVMLKTGTDAPQTSLNTLIDNWLTVRQPKEGRARERAQKALNRFVDIVGDMEPNTVTQAHAVQFRNALATAGVSAPSQRHYLDRLSALFSAALSEGLVPANPFRGIAPRKQQSKHVDRKKVKPFTGAQVRLILQSVEDHRFGPEGLHADTLWLFKLCAWHGLRINEAAQLQKEDVSIEQGIRVLKIHDDGDRSVKNFQSVRTVPLHNRCEAFFDYASKAKGPRVLRFAYYQEGGYAGWVVRNFPRFRRDVCGLSDTKLKFHSFRHAFIDAARSCGMPDNVRHSLTGHRREAGVAGDYGEGAKLSVRKKWIDRVNVFK